jgi:hypothetical protein
MENAVDPPVVKSKKLGGTLADLDAVVLGYLL